MKKLWNNLPITKKLMAVTILLFFVFCTVFFFGQMALFEGYYTNTKLNIVKHAADQFARDYESDADGEDYRARMAELSDEYNCYFMLLSEDGTIKYTLSYYMEIETQEGEMIRLSLDNAVHDSGFEDLKLDIGSEVAVNYISGGDDTHTHSFFTLSITYGEKIWSAVKREEPRYDAFAGQPSGQNDIQRPADRASDEQNGRHIRPNTTQAQGIITSIVLPNGQNRNISAERASAAKAVMDWVSGRVGQKIKTDGGMSSYFYTDEERGDRYCVVVKDTQNNDVVFAIAPLNMVREAVDVATHVYILWFCFTMVGACVLGIIFARVVTRPVIEMTDITKSMAALDFGRHCEYSANDEVGELAGNINLLSDTLSKTIAELQSANERLQADIEHERAVEESRREFVAAASHELKTPLGIIRAYTEAIIDGVSETKQSRYMQIIVDETEKMDSLILDMLDNAKLESGSQKLVLSEHDLSEITCNLLHRFDEVMRHKHIEAVTEVPKQPVIKSFDVDMIERVINNFIANAVNHTPDYGRIICSVTVEEDKATVSVENSGSHIDDADYEHIWDRFYKADKSRHRSTDGKGGTGLGLSIAKNILIMHKAEYGVSNTDTGVKFYFSLS